MTKKLMTLMLLGAMAVSQGCNSKLAVVGMPDDQPSDRASQLVGTWEIDAAAINKSVAKVDGDDAEQLKAQAEFMASMKVSFQFDQDGGVTSEMSMLGRTRSESGKYQVDSKDADSVTISLQDMGKNSPGKVKVRFLSENQIQMEPVDELGKKRLGPIAMILKRRMN